MKRAALASAGVLAALLVVLFVMAPWRGDDKQSDAPVTAAEATDLAVESAGTESADGPTEHPTSSADESASLPAAPLHVESSDAPTRQAATASNDIEIVVTTNGQPLEGAHVIVASVLRDPPWDSAAEPHSWEREQLRGAFTPFEALVSLRTGADGVCAVSRDSLASVDRAVVIGVLHERAFGEVRAVQVADLPATDRIDITLDAAEPVRAVVRGAVEGARVEVTQSALYGDFRSIEGYTDEWVSRPMLRFTHTRSGSGAVALFPMRDRCLVTVRAGDERAPPFVGTIAGALEFDVAPTFEVEGRTIDLDDPMLEALVRVQALDPVEARWIDLGVGAMETDGSFAAFDVAWQEGAAEWRVRGEAAGRHTVVASLVPSPGGRFFVEFDAPSFVRYDVWVVDGSTHEPIMGGSVTVDWEGRVDPPWTELTCDRGLAHFGHLPIGVRISIDVEVKGYTKEPTHVRTVEAHFGYQAWRVEAYPLCRVRGRIAPSVAGRETMLAELKRVAPISTSGQRFEVEVLDGVFEFDGLGGESALLLLHNERGSCGPIEIAQGAGLVDIGTLELEPYVSARARVLDAVTGDPIVGAKALVRREDGTPIHMTLGEPAHSDEFGVVRIERFPSEGAWLIVEWPGSTPGWFDRATFDGAAFDFGDVVLHPQRVFDVQLDLEPRRPNRFRLVEWVEPPRSVAFDMEGRARLPIHANAQRVNLVDPAGRFEQLRAIGRLSDLPQPFLWPAPPGRLAVKLVGVDESDEQYLQLHNLIISWRDDAGWYERWVTFSCVDGTPPTRRVPASKASYRVEDGLGRLVRWGRADLAAFGDQELVLDLGADVATLRVVDGAGAPMRAVYVRGFDRRFPPARHASSVGNFETDANGEAWVPLFESGALGLALLGPNDEILPDVDTTDWRNGGVHEVVLAPKGGFELVVRASTHKESVVKGADVSLHTRDERMRLTRWSTGDDGRLRRPAIAPETYLFEVAKAGHWTRKLPVEIGAAGSTPVEILLPELARLEVKLVDVSGAPLSNTPVELLHEALDEFHSEWLAQGRVSGATVTDLAGRITLDGVPAGVYVVGVGGYEVGAASTGVGVSTVVVR